MPPGIQAIGGFKMNTTTNKGDLKGLKVVNDGLKVTINVRRFYYITQYASYMTDSGYYSSLKECLTSNFEAEGLTQGEVTEVMDRLGDLISELMPLVSDSINNNIYDIIYQIHNINQVENIISLYNNILDCNIYDIPGIEDYMGYNSIFSPDLWHELADEDLRQNGTDANALYWVNEIDFNCDYLEMNGYANGFYKLDTEDIISTYINDGYFDFSELLEV